MSKYSKQEPTFIRRNEEKQVYELVDRDTGEVIFTEPLASAKFLSTKRSKVHKIKDAEGREIWVQKGVNPEHLPQTTWPYNEITASHIFQEIMSGKTITQIARLPGFPSARIMENWRVKHEEFAEGLRTARKLQGDYYADRVVEVAEEEPISELDLKHQKKQIEAYKWRAEKGNPSAWGAKQESATPGGTTVIIQTGIDRSEKAVESDVIDVEKTTETDPS